MALGPALRVEVAENGHGRHALARDKLLSVSSPRKTAPARARSPARIGTNCSTAARLSCNPVSVPSITATASGTASSAACSATSVSAARRPAAGRPWPAPPAPRCGIARRFGRAGPVGVDGIADRIGEIGQRLQADRARPVVDQHDRHQRLVLRIVEGRGEFLQRRRPFFPGTSSSATVGSRSVVTFSAMSPMVPAGISSLSVAASASGSASDGSAFGGRCLFRVLRGVGRRALPSVSDSGGPVSARPRHRYRACRCRPRHPAARAAPVRSRSTGAGLAPGASGARACGLGRTGSSLSTSTPGSPAPFCGRGKRGLGFAGFGLGRGAVSAPSSEREIVGLRRGHLRRICAPGASSPAGRSASRSSRACLNSEPAGTSTSDASGGGCPGHPGQDGHRPEHQPRKDRSCQKAAKNAF